MVIYAAGNYKISFHLLILKSFGYIMKIKIL